MRKRILLVDDAPTVLQYEKFLLSRGPYDLDTASNGEEAVNKATHGQFDLIVMDINMPVMDGVEACGRLKQDQGTQAIPILMLTARSEVDMIANAKKAGCDAYLMKPVKPQVFREQVQKLLDGAGMRLQQGGGEGETANQQAAGAESFPAIEEEEL